MNNALIAFELVFGQLMTIAKAKLRQLDTDVREVYVVLLLFCFSLCKFKLNH